ncbi:hypothetical protein F5Y19DRAFT_492432 [Xylariaceae sp. FL1651]|nr:hypothetical protein F5Y19DRAFT_492432 [Xylariaceae sp. FL1651]
MDPFTALSLAGTIVQFIDFGIKLTVNGSEIYHSVSGQTQADAVIFQDTNRLGEFSEQLSRSFSNHHSKAEAKVASLARECAVEAQKLRAILYGLQGLTLAEKVRAVLDELGGATDAEKLSALLSRFQGATEAKELNTILDGHQNATDADKLRIILRGLPPQTERKKSSSLVAALKSLWKKKEVQEIHENLKEYRAQLTLYMVGLINDKHSSMTTLLEKLVEMNSLANSETSSQLDELQHTLSQVRGLISQASKPEPNADKNLSPLPDKLHFLIKVGDEAIETVLGGLRFESMRAREATVTTAYSKTFEWLFADESKFRQWLSTSSGIFWVSGKPGSGKSTLMKFVSQHKESKKVLRTWAGDNLLITASFYFWNPGTPMQRSLQGLVQTILYQIIRSCPLLIPIIAPDRWANALNKAAQDPWTWEEATATLDRFIKQKKIRCATCLFIDGLDEFDGDHMEMVKILSRVSETLNMKLCLASRPYNVFVDAYGQSPNRMIRLQDLTREDIRQYVYDNFQTHSSLSRTSIYTGQYEVLVGDIVNKAEGVFLWVYLVVRSLKVGFTNADTVSKLQQRLQKLPSDLSEYFAYILRSVDDVYWEDTAKVFQMVVSSQYGLPPGVLSVLDEDDSDFCLNVEIRQIPLHEYNENVQIIERRLSARCKGLLEIRETPGSTWGSADYIRDFLRNQDVDNVLKSRLSGSFDVDLTLCRGFLLHLKRFIIADDPSISKELSFTKAFEDLVFFAQRSETISGAPPSLILDEALRSVKVIGNDYNNITESMFYNTIIRHGLPRYMEHRYQINPQLPQRVDNVPLLAVALTSASTQSEGILLNASRRTVWRFFMAYMLGSGADYLADDPDLYFRTFAILLTAGAERYATLTDEIHSLFGAQQARQLEQLIKDLDEGKQTLKMPGCDLTIACDAEAQRTARDLNNERVGDTSHLTTQGIRIQESKLVAKGDTQVLASSQDRFSRPSERRSFGSRLSSVFRYGFRPRLLGNDKQKHH